MHIILAHNPNPPYALIQCTVPQDVTGLKDPDVLLAFWLKRHKEVGNVPCETQDEQNQILAEYKERHDAYQAAHPGNVPVPPLVLPPVGVHYVVAVEDLPDQYFFNCWEWNNGCKVNMPKARGLHMDVIRVARDKELVKKDVPFMRAVEAGDTSAQAAIATEKQVLRDIPQTFDLTTDTEEELMGKWPAELPARE